MSPMPGSATVGCSSWTQNLFHSLALSLKKKIIFLFIGCAGSLLLRGLFITLLSLLIAAAPLAAEHRLKGTELQSLQPVGSTLAVLWL